MLAVALVFQMSTGIPVALDADSALTSIRNFVRISDNLATGGQPTEAEIGAIADRGFDVVVNLAPAREETNGREGFIVADRGMTYVNIPVSWQEPSFRDLEMFMAVMQANRDRRVFVHCQANMRASAFTYLYRSLVEGVDELEARKYMEVVWDPAGDERWSQWGAFVEDARQQSRRSR